MDADSNDRDKATITTEHLLWHAPNKPLDARLDSLLLSTSFVDYKGAWGARPRQALGCYITLGLGGNVKRNRVYLMVLTVVLANAVAVLEKGSSLNQGSAQDDPIYGSEVDVNAVMTNLADLRPGVCPDCKRKVQVTLSVVLRKSGEVTDAKIVKSSECCFDKHALKIIKNLKFTPAQKNGVAVSQRAEVSFTQFLG